MSVKQSEEKEKITEGEGLLDAKSRVFREIIKTQVAKSILKMVLNEIDPESTPKLVRTLVEEDTELTLSILSSSPKIINTFPATVRELSSISQKIPPRMTKEIVTRIIEDIDTKGIGETVNETTQVINNIQKKEPEFLAEILSKPIWEIILTTDFGLLRETIENSSQYIEILTKKATDALIYKGGPKGLNLISTGPTLANAAFRGINESVKPGVERYSKEAFGELLADLGYSMIDKLDGREMGKTINYSAELISTVHEGDKVLGPRIPETCEGLSREIISEVDGDVLADALVALSEDVENIATPVSDAVWEDPAEFVLPMTSASPSIVNPLVRTSREFMSGFDEIPPEFTADVVSSALGETDAEEIAGLINDLLRTVNQVNEADPELIPEFASEIFSNLDLEEVKEFVQLGSEIFSQLSEEINEE